MPESQVTDGYVGCAASLKSLVQRRTEPVYVPGARICGYDYGSEQWKRDPCCNPSSNLSQCCAAKDLLVNLTSTQPDPLKAPVCLPEKITRKSWGKK